MHGLAATHEQQAGQKRPDMGDIANHAGGIDGRDLRLELRSAEDGREW
jgi:hypothetical protein